MNDIEFAKSLEPYLFKAYSLGDPSKGWDCLNCLGDWAKKNGLEFPDEFEGWTWENYTERWNRGDGMDVLRRFLMSLGDSVNINYMLPGDILVLEARGVVGAAQYLGSGHVKVVERGKGGDDPKSGTFVFPLWPLIPFTIRVCRLRKKGDRGGVL